MSGKGNAAEAESIFRKYQHTFLIRLIIKGFIISTKYLPVWFLRIAGHIFVLLFIFFNRKNFDAIKKNIKKIMPGPRNIKYSCMAYEVFRNYSYYLIDIFYISHDPERFKKYRCEIKGIENFEKACEEKKGVILLTTHLGNWELGSMALSSAGKQIHVVYSPDSSEILEGWRRSLRSRSGICEIPLVPGEFSAIKLLRILKAGGIIALQGDRLTFDRGIKAEFFGYQALFPRGPVKLALISGSMILPIFIPITGYKSYRVIIDEPVLMKGYDDPEIEVKTNLDKIIKILEKNIRKYPTQWYTFMHFWEEDKKETL